MSELDKARAKDRAIKEKNANIGGSIGSAAGGLGGMAAGAATGAAIGSVIPVVGTAIGGLLGGAIGAFGGEKLGNILGKGAGSLFGGNEEKKFKEEQEKRLEAQGLGTIKSNDEAVKILTSIDNKLSVISGKSIGIDKKILAANTIKSLPIIGNFMKVIPSKESTTDSSNALNVGKTDINLNVSGTIKLEGGGKSVDLDLAKLLDTPEFKRQITDIITRRINENSNSGKRNMESERNNMASQYNRSGK
jgi:hypothetical protein